MAEVIEWPRSLLAPLSATYFLRSSSRSAGVSLTGNEQIVSNGIRRWEVTFDLPRQFSGDLLRQFEVAVNRMEGRRNIAALPICDPYRYGEQRSPRQQPWSDGTWFSDGTGWAAPGAAPVEVTQAAPVGARTLWVKVTQPAIPNLSAGDYFSHDGFLYQVTGRTPDGWVRFAPNARRPIPAGAVLATDPPVFHGRFADDDQGRRAREMLRWGAETSLTFVEAFDR